MQKKIGMFGFADKTEFLVSLAKVLTIMDKKVLLFDATLNDKLKYAIPAFDYKEKQSIIHYDGIDFAVGFNDFSAINESICTGTSDVDDYDFIIVDVDTPDRLKKLSDVEFSKLYFVMEQTTVSLIRNRELLDYIVETYNELTKNVDMTKIHFKTFMTRAGEQYYNARYAEYPVNWNSNIYEIPYNEQDNMAAVDSQLAGYIDMSRHSKQYMTLVTDLASELLVDVNANDIRKAIKLYIRRSM